MEHHSGTWNQPKSVKQGMPNINVQRISDKKDANKWVQHLKMLNPGSSFARNDLQSA